MNPQGFFETSDTDGQTRDMTDPLRVIPGIGPSLAGDLRALGIERVQQLMGEDPNVLYERLCVHQGVRVDRCVLYVFRCAIYFAEGGKDSELLKWWNWKDAANPPLDRLTSRNQ